ncbi:hypothetical protein IKE98_02065 [Candidatus Saccharibacteria bacterium]|nr:hypothetical protein [Candidatus Saccharibacteria bacterium]
MTYNDMGAVEAYIDIKNVEVKHIKFFHFYSQCAIPLIEVNLDYSSSKYLSENLEKVLQDVEHLSYGTVQISNTDLIKYGMFTIRLATLREECNAERVKAVMDMLILATKPFSGRI